MHLRVSIPFQQVAPGEIRITVLNLALVGFLISISPLAQSRERMHTSSHMARQMFLPAERLPTSLVGASELRLVILDVLLFF
jgi:hypothetical protein